MVTVPDAVVFQRVGVVVAVAVAFLALRRLDPDGEWGAALRARFAMGVPWGTLVVVAGVLAVYLVVQGGLDHWYRPVTIPYRAWSYFYPLGMVLSSFSHTGAGHLVGNLVGTVAFAAVAEYAYGHFPRTRGSSSFAGARSNPWVRALVVVPAVTAATGLVLAAFSLGPVIGFSGVVYAFAGFALVYYPLTTVLASVGSRVVSLAYDALMTPQATVESRAVFVTPWFADIALQTHALGLLVGALGGLWLQSHRGEARPDPRRLWLGALVFAVSNSLWAVYWFRGNGQFVLYRAAGFALVVGLALLVAGAAGGPTRPVRDLLPSLGRATPTLRPDGSRDPGGFRAAVAAASVRQVALAVLLVSAAGLAGPAVLPNLVTTTGDDIPGQTVAVRDYQVGYAEDVPNGMVSAVDVEAFGESTRVNTSGVIVTSDRRGIWMQTVPTGQLALRGRLAVRVGGLGWRDTVVVERDGWNVAGAGTVYRVHLTHGGETVTAFTTPPQRAEAIVSGRNVSVRPTASGYELGVTVDDTRVVGPLPRTNETVTLNGVTFFRMENGLFATADETRVRVATKETYRRS